MSLFEAVWSRRRARNGGTAAADDCVEAVFGGGTGDLVNRWCKAAVSTGWATSGDWWTPAVEAVADALLDGRDVAPAAWELGRSRADGGAGLAESLDDLATLYRVSGLGEPPHRASRALALAWADEALNFLHALSCEDPLTGLASLAHVRTRLAEIYREAERDARPVSVTHALLVVELVDRPADPIARALMLTDVSDCLRLVFSGSETLGRANGSRALALVNRASDLPRSAELLRDLLVNRQHLRDSEAPRIWVEGLPRSTEAAIRLLDELAR